MNKQSKRFKTVNPKPTDPSADDGSAGASPPPPPPPPPSKGARGTRSAFTWRLRPDQTLMLDELQLRLRRDLGVSRLDRADWLDALVRLASDSPGIYGALVAELQAVE